MNNTAVRLARAYWRWNEELWEAIRPLHRPLIVLIGAASMAAWGYGLSTGNALLHWAPAAFSTACLIAVVVDR